MVKSVIIVGGGTAGWISAAYLARMLQSGSDGGIKITLIESPDIGILGVGEGTFPSIRKTLKRIGLDESDLVRDASATFKQGIRFANWRYTPGHEPQPHLDHYFHPFQIAGSADGLDLLPYWLLGVAGDSNWDAVNTLQKFVADHALAPKLISHDNYAGPLNYAYHFDAVKFARLLRKKGIELGVSHLTGNVEGVGLSEDGAIDHLKTREHGDLKADFYIDCTGFRAQLIGETLKRPYRSCRSVLFADRAVALQIPYEDPAAPIPSYTVSTAQENGWTWDIGLDSRRGIGYVYSSDHTSDDRAAEVLRRYIGPAANDMTPRAFSFDPGYRPESWYKNCVSIGLSSGFFEPLEATGIGFIEISALILSNLFPFANDYETCARQFNAIMAKRYDHVLDFLKLHYCLTERRDTTFWRDNVEASTIPDSLHEKLDRWRHRPPDFMDVDLNHDIFTDANWQYVLYGMGYKTDLSAKASIYRFYDEARAQFADIRQQGRVALQRLPGHRALIDQVQLSGFTPRRAA